MQCYNVLFFSNRILRKQVTKDHHRVFILQLCQTTYPNRVMWLALRNFWPEQSIQEEAQSFHDVLLQMQTTRHEHKLVFIHLFMLCPLQLLCKRIQLHIQSHDRNLPRTEILDGDFYHSHSMYDHANTCRIFLKQGQHSSEDRNGCWNFTGRSKKV